MAAALPLIFPLCFAIRMGSNTYRSLPTRAGTRVRKRKSQKRAADSLPVIEAIKAEGAVTVRQIV